ncbi:MAG: GTPase ObgE [Vicinamibacteria bacterium]|nr:GTPase ObgE [Vicinamibacteria bacterium]
MFVDRVKIFVKGGDGGRGCSSFRREAYVPMGGPDGGNGGAGGDVILIGRVNQNTLLPLRFHTEFRAKRGGHGGPSNRTGRDAPDTHIDVPLGTIVREEGTDIVMGEVVADEEEVLIAKGGRGGRGNKSYLSNTNRAPRNADPGEAGEEHWLWLDLKLLADVGLVGLPNAGKSTLLSKISAAKPKIADYPFTTLTPVLGMASWDDYDFVVADVPGIIEGASTGSGLGLDFLRHIERTRVLVHVIDASGISGRDATADYETIGRELDAFLPALSSRPRVIVASKRDLVSKEDDPLAALQALAERDGLELFAVSAATGQGLKELTQHLAGALQTPREEASA